MLVIINRPSNHVLYKDIIVNENKEKQNADLLLDVHMIPRPCRNIVNILAFSTLVRKIQKMVNDTDD